MRIRKPWPLKLPPAGFKAYHSEKNELIYFFEYTIFVSNDGENFSIFDSKPIGEYITHKMQLFCPKEIITPENIPKLPPIKLDIYEKIIFTITSLFLLASLIMVFEFCNFYISPHNKEHGSMVRTAFDVLYSLIFGIYFLILIIFWYKFNVKE